MKRMLVVLRALPLACGVLLALAVQSSAAFAASWAPGVEASLPGNAGSDPHVFPYSLSCPSAGNCTAVGTYSDSSGHTQGLLLTETAGTWAAGLEAMLPANAGSDPDVGLSVSCPSAGACSAVGEYADSSGHIQGLLLTETAGTWAAGAEASLPANAGSDPDVGLNSVSCASAGNCTAVGSYTDSSGYRRGVVLTETARTWAMGVEASLPGNAASNPKVSLRSVSCATAGNCSAVGNYDDSSSHTQGLLLTETAGTWTGVEAILPAGTASNPTVPLASVSCASAGNCGAVGHYSDSAGNTQGLLLTETAGAWATGVEASLPGNAGSSPNVSIRSVSCASAGNCSAVGDYLDSSAHSQGLLLTEIAGIWTTGVEASLPANGGSNPGARLDSVSCASVANCSAVGYYSDSSGHGQGLLLSTVRRLKVLKKGSGRGSVTSSPAGINCGASCSHGFDNGRSVTLTTRAARGSWFAGWSGACSGKGGCRVKMTAERTVTARFALLPNTKITKAKIDPANQRAKFKFKARGKSKGFQCALVKAKKHKKPKAHFSRCSSPKTYTSLAPGRYTFRVRAFNAGGPDPTPAKKSFRL